ncbi:circularly permuted type 2 ATP-grasp protein [Roseospira goensis]|uniref:Putative circularly permuted ATP-grasp superfamily protein n=1 Tax=Roseospira goensis TaxID=391922 RepID=A0A7W6RYR6_9PROT|nr:circularly permuted type 2 ATP-grasp protein [Roseospira goensis]MBB4285521.1 putative circularly permuted ATP-grasp superfamily protein [Roseospira goensis]
MGAASSAFDEMYRTGTKVRAPYQTYRSWLRKAPPDLLSRRHAQADMLFRRIGITFAVYGEAAGGERLIPFDVIPRILSRDEWKVLSKGVCQRIEALNRFIHDVYHDQEILRAGLVPRDLVLGNGLYRPEMQGFTPPGGVYVHIGGIDVVRTGETAFHVLEDNLRTPSGVSYMLEDREIMMRLFPDLFDAYTVAPVNHYPQTLLRNLRYVAPPGRDDPTVVLLTPGQFNSAYFEHAFLADEMGIELVQGQDLFVDDDSVFMRTIEGPRRVDVIYRRIDDDFLDPKAFRSDSLLGVPGLFQAYRKGRVTLANAIGTGIADDKAIYHHVPAMIRFYLSEEPVLANVPTWFLKHDEDRAYVLDHLSELVVKEVHGSGGYGMLIGPQASRQEISEYRERIVADPGNFIAQPTLALSTCPTFVDQGIAPRHVDLRPFVLTGETTSVVPGGLTRVALRDGSLVVNSSQGGGTKDTWVLER